MVFYFSAPATLYSAKSISISLPRAKFANCFPTKGPIVNPEEPRPLAISRLSSPGIFPMTGRKFGVTGRKPTFACKRLLLINPGAIGSILFKISYIAPIVGRESNSSVSSWVLPMTSRSAKLKMSWLVGVSTTGHLDVSIFRQLDVQNLPFLRSHRKMNV